MTSMTSASSSSNSSSTLPQIEPFSSSHPLSSKSREKVKEVLTGTGKPHCSLDSPYYKPTINACDLVRRHLNAEIDLNNPEHERAISIALRTIENLKEPEKLSDPSWNTQEKDIALKFQSWLHNKNNQEGRSNNRHLNRIEKGWDCVTSPFQNLVRCLKQEENGNINLQIIQKTLDPNDLTSQRVHEVLNLTLSPEAREYVHRLALMNMDHRLNAQDSRVTAQDTRINTLEGAIDTLQTRLSAVEELSTNAGILMEFFNALDAFKEIQETQNTQLKGQLFELSEETAQLIVKLKPTLDTINHLAELVKTQTALEADPTLKESTADKPIRDKAVVQTVQILAAMATTYFHYDAVHQRDQDSIKRQCELLKEVVYAESHKWGKVLQDGEFHNFQHWELPKIERFLLNSITLETARPHFTNREKNYQESMSALSTIRSRIAEGYKQQEILNQHIESTAANSEAASQRYDKRIKRAQRQLHYAGKRVGAMQALRSGMGLFSFVDPLLGAGLGVGMELASIPFQQSYERKLRRVNKLLDSYQRTNQTYSRAGSIHEHTAGQNATHLVGLRQQEAAIHAESLAHPELFKPRDFCRVIQENIVTIERDIRTLEEDLASARADEQKARDDHEAARQRVVYLDGFKGKNKDLNQIEENTAKQKHLEALIGHLQIVAKNLDTSIKERNGDLKRRQEDLNKALALAPYQESIYLRIREYLPESSDAQAVLRNGHREIEKGIQENVAPYREASQHFYQLIQLFQEKIQKYDPKNKLRLPQTGYLAIQAAEAYAALQSAKNGWNTIQSLFTPLAAYDQTLLETSNLTPTTNTRDLQSIWQFILNPGKWIEATASLENWKNALNSLQQLSIADFLLYGFNPTAAATIQVARLCIAYKHWKDKTLPQDAIYTVYEKLKELTLKSHELLEENLNCSKEIKAELKLVKGKITDLDTWITGGINKLSEKQDYAVFLTIQSDVKNKESDLYKTLLETPLAFEQFGGGIRSLSDNHVNPLTRPHPRTGAQEVIDPPVWMALFPTWYTSRLNYSILNHKVSGQRRASDSDRCPNLDLLLQASHQYVQSVCRRIKRYQIEVSEKSPEDAVLIESIKSSSKLLLKEIDQALELLGNFSVIFNATKESHSQCVKAICKKISTVNKDRQNAAIDLSKYLNEKRTKAEEYYYMADLCYRLTRVAIPVFEKSQAVLPPSGVGLTDSLLSFTRFLLLNSIEQTALNPAILMPMIANATALSPTAQTIVGVSVASAGKLALQMSKEKIDRVIKFNRETKQLFNLSGIEDKSFKRIIHDFALLEVCKKPFGNQLQVSLVDNKWQWSLDALYHPRSTWLGSSEERLYKGSTNPLSKAEMQELGFTKPQPCEVVISSDGIIPRIYYASKIISYDEVKALPDATIQQQYFSFNMATLLFAYREFLETIQKGGDPSSLPFAQQLDGYRLILPAEELATAPGQLKPTIPLAFPAKLVEQLELNFDYMSLYDLGNYKIYYALDYVEAQQSYAIHFEVKKIEENGLKSTVARPFIGSIDKNSVNCFKKIVVSSNECQILEQPDINEVLLLAMYTRFVPGLGMPSKLIFETESKLTVTTIEPFVGFYDLWSRNPTKIIAFNSATHGPGNKPTLIDIIVNPTSEGVRLEEKYRDPETRFSSMPSLKTYAHHHRLFKAFCCLISKKDEIEIGSLFEEELGWFNPESVHFLEKMKFLESLAQESEPSIVLQRFNAILNKEPAHYREDLKRYKRELELIYRVMQEGSYGALE